MKTCARCRELLPDDSFAIRNRNGKVGTQAYCRKCNTKQKQDWIAANRQKKSSNRLWHLYRLRQPQYDLMRTMQDNACAICRKEFTKTPHVDHDHACCAGARSCGACVRGLLCGACNARLAWLESNHAAIMQYKAHSSSGQDASFSHS